MTSEPPLSFGALLRRYRECAGLTQEALAEQAGLTPNAIGALERGERRQPYPHTLLALATALRLDAEQHDLLVRLARAKQQGSSARASADAPAIVQALARPRADRPSQAALPIAPNTLLGREDELGEIVRALTDRTCRLVTLVGPGGVGKTRLALQVATDLAAHFADGVAWVALTPVAAAEHVPVAIADVLHLPLRGTEPPADQVLDALGDREMLLVLDNLEHLLEATSLLAAILERVPGVRLLVTSRERLRITGEWAIDLQGLALPERLTSADIVPTAAIQLFAERARQVSHGFVVTPANLAAVARICRLVEGMPLGIELSAAWIGTLAPAEIADEIERNLDFLQRADRNAPARHRSLRAVFDHSWNLLAEQERHVLPRLAVFRGGCGRAAAESIAGASLAVLAALVDKSLLHRTVDATGTARYDLHELVRQYALAGLQADPGEEIRIRDQHCAYYARQLDERMEALQSDAMYMAWTEIAADMDNIRGAWTWAAKQQDHQTLARMGQSIYMVCEIRGLFEEGMALFREAAEALRAQLEAGSPNAAAHNPELLWTLGQMLSWYGSFAAGSGRYAEARDRLHEGYKLLQERDDLLVRTGTLLGLGYATYVLGAYAEARAWFTRSIDLARAHAHPFFLATSQTILALIAQAQGADDALGLAEAALADWRALGHPHGLTTGLLALSSILLEQGITTRAEEAAREGLQLAAGVQGPWATGAALLQLGTVLLAQEKIAQARDLVEESVAIFTELGEPWGRGRGLVARGWVAHAEGNPSEAHTSFQQALNLARALQLEPIALNAQFGLAYLMREDAPGAALAFLEQIIAHPAAEQATRQRALDLHEVLSAAERGSAAQPDPAGVPVLESGEALTPREVEVLRLLAQGRSNQAIAAELVVVVGTVKRHVNSILGKLHAESRLEAVARARDLGLL